MMWTRRPPSGGMAVAAGTVAVRSMTAEQRSEFMLEAAGLDRAVHAAFLGRAGLPPPSARARIRALGDRAGARRASDGLVALVIELVVGDVVDPDVIPHLFFGPIGQRRELHDTAVVVI